MTAENPAEDGPKISKRAAEKEAKKAAARLKKAEHAAVKPTKPATKTETPLVPENNFKQGWLKGVYNEKPVQNVHTRFPPEPNGYLHIGHAKAITVNFGFAKAYGGVCNLRFDDTNPQKEEERFFTSIKDMVRWLGFQPHKITHSSDFFDELYDLAEELIRRNKAYVCYCTKEDIRKGRGEMSEKTPDGKKRYGPRSVCAHWSQSVQYNLDEFRAMKKDKYGPGEAHLRMKQYLGTDPSEYQVTDDDNAEVKQSKLKLKALAENSALWDMAAYRITKETYHHRTGDKWRIYPTYEFTHCLCDDFEGITHSLCTVEFETLRPAYNWLLESLDRKLPLSDEKGPMQREYGRLNVEGTILSKRNIEKLVNGSAAVDATAAMTEAVDTMQLAEEGPDADDEQDTATVGANTQDIPPVVDGWDDPRLFTLVALKRRGVPPGALKKFVLELGITKANADTKTHIMDATMRSYLERTVPRLMLILDPIKLTITNLPSSHLEMCDVPFDPKDAAKGTHQIPFTNTIYIDRDDFRQVDDPDFFRLAPGKSVGLLHVAHPLRATRFTTDANGQVDEIFAEYGPDIPSGKARIHWIAESKAHNSPIKAECRVFDKLFDMEGRPNFKDGSYYKNVNPKSKVVYENAMVECGFEQIRQSAPWPKEEGEASGVADNCSVRFQGVRTAYFCLDADATKDKIVLNRIVSLKEDTGKK